MPDAAAPGRATSGLTVDLTSRFRPLPLRAVLRRALRAAAAAEGVAPGSRVGVLVCDDAEIRDLNRRFAGVDAATDVLSFPAAATTGAFTFAPGAELELGDIALSLDHLRRQAETAGHSLETEAATLAIHGLLHLTGHDHATPEEEGAMFDRTAAILARLGLDPAAARRAGQH